MRPDPLARPTVRAPRVTRARLAPLAVAILAVALAAAPSSRAQEEPEPPTEKSLTAEFKDAMKSSDPAYRAAAISAYSEATRQLDDGGASRAVAKQLAKGLGDDELEVQAAAILALSWGRDPGTVLDAFEDHIKQLRNEIEKRLTRPDEESIEFRKDATRQYSEICEALGRHADDRAVEILRDQLRTLTKNTKGGNNLSTLLSTQLATALLELGSQEAVEAVVKQTAVYVNPGQAGPAKRLHAALAAFSDERGWAPSTYAQGYDQVWRDWFGTHEKEFSKTLGRLDAPVAAPVYDPMERERDRREDVAGGRRP